MSRASRMAGALAAALAAPVTAHAQFDTFNWTLGGDPNGSGTLSPTLMHLVSSDAGVCGGVPAGTTHYTTTAPVGGAVSVHLSFDNQDTCFASWHFEQPVYLINGVQHVAVCGPSCSDFSADFSFHVEAGDVFGFGAHSVDCSCGPSVADFTQFQFTPDPLGDPALHVFHGDSPGDELGYSVDGAGDVDGDGVGDVVAGAPYDDDFGNLSGSARVLSGKGGALLFTFHGDSAGDYLGWSVGGAGDVDGDGFADVVAGAPLDAGSANNTGSARVFSGKTGAVLYAFFGDSADDRLGWAVSGAGDVDADGFDDVIATAPYDDNNGFDSGIARVFSGRDGTILHTFVGDSPDDWFGHSADGAGDADGDGFADVVVGTWRDDNNGADSGSARVLSGQSGAILFTFDGAQAGEQLGSSVAGGEDVDGDGFADVVVGAPGTHLGTKWSAGAVHVYSGVTGAVLHSFHGALMNDRLGSAVGVAGDVDGDGLADVVAGAPLADAHGYLDSGYATVFSGQTGAVLASFDGDTVGQRLGWSVGGTGDVNGDGFGDVVVGVPFDDAQGGGGTVRVLSGSCGTIAVHGVGCAGSGGFTPILQVGGCAARGALVEVVVEGGVGGAMAMVQVSTTKASAPLGGGCTLNLGPFPGAVLFLGLLGGAGPGDGGVEVPATVPSTVSGPFVLQAFLQDAGSALGFTTTNGVEVSVP